MLRALYNYEAISSATEVQMKNLIDTFMNNKGKCESPLLAETLRELVYVADKYYSVRDWLPHNFRLDVAKALIDHFPTTAGGWETEGLRLYIGEDFQKAIFKALYKIEKVGMDPVEFPKFLLNKAEKIRILIDDRITMYYTKALVIEAHNQHLVDIGFYEARAALDAFYEAQAVGVSTSNK